MAKIVINVDYGGFSLSPDGLEAYANKKGIKLYWFRYNNQNFEDETLTPTEKPEFDHWGYLAYTVPNPDIKTASFSNRDIPRDDLTLVEVVEELGEKASGRFASLKVVEIPDDVKWCIEEYDGSEWVSEVHRTWS